MSASAKAARTEVHAALVGVADLGTSAVVNHEPYPGGLPKPVAVTVASAGMTPTDFQVAVRVYASTGSLSAEAAWDALDDTMIAVDSALDGVDAPRSSWSVTWSEPHDAFIALCTLDMPREDF